MPLPPPTAPPDPRIAAERARAQRTQRVGRLRRQVIAASATTFALAFGLVAFNGSMGAQTASSKAAAATRQQQPPADDFAPSDDLGAGSDDSGASSDDFGQANSPGRAPAPATSSQS